MALADRLDQAELDQLLDDGTDGRVGEIGGAGEIGLRGLAGAAQPLQDEPLVIAPQLRGIASAAVAQPLHVSPPRAPFVRSRRPCGRRLIQPASVIRSGRGRVNRDSSLRCHSPSRAFGAARKAARPGAAPLCCASPAVSSDSACRDAPVARYDARSAFRAAKPAKTNCAVPSSIAASADHDLRIAELHPPILSQNGNASLVAKRSPVSTAVHRTRTGRGVHVSSTMPA